MSLQSTLFGVLAAMADESGILVTPNTGVSSNSDTPANAPVYAGVQYNSNGSEYGSDAGGTFNVGRGVWLDAGLNSEVWVQRVVNSGTLDGTDSGSGRLVLSTTRAFSIQRGSLGTDTANVTFNFYDAASGGNLLTSVTLDFTADVSF